MNGLFWLYFSKPSLRVQSCLLHINLFRRTLRSLLYEKDFPLPATPAIKALWRAKNDIQHFLVTVSQTARANSNII